MPAGRRPSHPPLRTPREARDGAVQRLRCAGAGTRVGGSRAALPGGDLRWLWPAYVTPGRPGRPTTQQELRRVYGPVVAVLGRWLFAVDNVLFPDQHQEYGVLSLRAYEAGATTAEPQLLDFAIARAQGPTPMLPVPSWVHPAWLPCAGLLRLEAARRVTGLRWAATTLAAAVLAAAGALPPGDWRPGVVRLTGTAITVLWVTRDAVARSRRPGARRAPPGEPAAGGAPTG